MKEIKQTPTYKYHYKKWIFNGWLKEDGKNGKTSN